MNILEIYNCGGSFIVKNETNIVIDTDHPELVSRPRDYIIDSMLCVIQSVYQCNETAVVTFKVVQ